MYSLSELENMIPWERESIIFLILDDLMRKQQENGG